jgi:hypothetical protein
MSIIAIFLSYFLRMEGRIKNSRSLSLRIVSVVIKCERRPMSWTLFYVLIRFIRKLGFAPSPGLVNLLLMFARYLDYMH